MDLNQEPNCRRDCEGTVEVYQLAADMGGVKTPGSGAVTALKVGRNGATRRSRPTSCGETLARHAEDHRPSNSVAIRRHPQSHIATSTMTGTRNAQGEFTALAWARGAARRSNGQSRTSTVKA